MFPLTATLFPGGRTVLNVFEQRYYELAKACIATGEGFGIVTLESGSEIGSAQSFAKVGTLVSIASFEAPKPNLFVLDCVGQKRFEVQSTKMQENGLHVANVRWLPPEPKLELPERYRPLATLLKQVVDSLGSTRFSEPFELDDATWVGSRLSEIIKMPSAIKQNLLEINDPELRLKMIEQIMQAGKGTSSH